MGMAQWINVFRNNSFVNRPVGRGGSVGSDEPPSQIKGPLFCAKRSTFYNKRSSFYNKRSSFYNKRSSFTIKGPPFSIKGPFSIQLVSKRSTIKKMKAHFL